MIDAPWGLFSILFLFVFVFQSITFSFRALSWTEQDKNATCSLFECKLSCLNAGQRYIEFQD